MQWTCAEEKHRQSYQLSNEAILLIFSELGFKYPLNQPHRSTLSLLTTDYFIWVLNWISLHTLRLVPLSSSPVVFFFNLIRLSFA